MRLIYSKEIMILSLLPVIFLKAIMIFSFRPLIFLLRSLIFSEIIIVLHALPLLSSEISTIDLPKNSGYSLRAILPDARSTICRDC